MRSFILWNVFGSLEALLFHLTESYFIIHVFCRNEQVKQPREGTTGRNRKKKCYTKGELDLEDLPPIEELHITVPIDHCQIIGHVSTIVEPLGEECFSQFGSITLLEQYKILTLYCNWTESGGLLDNVTLI